MEQVDQIIIQQLQQMDCPIEKNCKSLKSLDSDVILQCLIKCVTQCDPESGHYLDSINRSTSATVTKFKTCSRLATVCSKLGLKEEIGYEAFLYCDHSILRKVFLFLLERMPKDENHESTTEDDHIQIITKVPSKAQENVFPNDKLQVSQSHIINRELLQKEHETSDELEPDSPTTAENRAVLEKKIEELESELKSLQEKLLSSQNAIKSQNLSISEAETKLKSETAALEAIDADIKDLKQLKEEIQLEEEEFKSYQEQWEEISGPLLERLEKVKNEAENKNRRKNDLTRELATIKESMTSKLNEIDEKDSLIEEMKKKMRDDLPPNRDFYTQRIIELVNNVKRQDNETSKVLFDIRQLQKSINSTTGKVQRSYAITDEMIFKDAKTSDWNRKCYKLLATLHKDYDRLLDCVNEIGGIRRDILQLEGTVDNEKDKACNLDRIEQELQTLKDENSRLMAEKGAVD
ncbi:coiled-coil domain-containing protein 22 homolog [Brevipalpus obovatus]|uniref:coiled-coil domain-containing protein 22 homolog n=1 Tax=Brevipalpus obovatus TaxID=246614 RepID=UPI003D9E5F07